MKEPCPNIVSIQDIFEENNTAYYIMDYIDGVSLGDMIKKYGAIPEKIAVKYIRQVSSAISYMHIQSMNHLDIKPANIMVRSFDNLPILIDFGTSKQYDSEGEQTSTMQPGFTHGYAPMEQYKPGGVSIFTPQTDIYALGATLYALLTGNKPPHYSEILEDGLPELPLGISDSTKDGVKHAMQIRKNNRPASIEEFLLHFKGSINQIDNNSEDTATDVSPMKQTTDEISDETIVGSVVYEHTKEPQDGIVIDGYKFVDLGLSVLWASQNMGAQISSDIGIYVNKHDVNTKRELSELNLKGVIVPSIGQFEELRNNCNWEITEQNNITGYKITGRNGNSIFIPFSGENKIASLHTFGRLFTIQALYTDSILGQYYLYFSHGDYKLAKYACDFICPIRLIKQK